MRIECVEWVDKFGQECRAQITETVFGVSVVLDVDGDRQVPRSFFSLRRARDWVRRMKLDPLY